MPIRDIFGEFDESEDVSGDFYEQYKITQSNMRVKRKQDIKNDVPAVEDPSPEILAERDLYRRDYVKLHQNVYKSSTGIKPFGEDQETAIRRFNNICLQGRGAKLVQLEPRGFAKTSRAVNQMVAAALEGDIKFGLIVSSEISKSEEIMDQIQTELTSNEELHRLYPRVISCFQHGDGKFKKYENQTYNGEKTHITWRTDEIRFPILPGEKSSGVILLVRTKDNLRGLSKKITFGEDAGKVLRPDFVLLDDIQTDKDAKSPTMSNTIVQTIKKAALFGGSHSRKVRAVMTITPQKENDVAHHFVLKEPSWEVATYSMLKSMPTRMDLWDQFGRILLNFDKYREGEREKAQRRARAFLEENYAPMHEGAVCAWEWCYEWDVDDPIEISALHHAMTFYYEEGPEAFDCECQCKLIIPKNDEQQVIAPPDLIISRTSNMYKRQLPQEVKTVVTHVDMNHEILTYVTLGCDTVYRPFVIDYGTYPQQPTSVWKKKDLVKTLYDVYPEISKGDIGALFYRAIIDFSKILVNTNYPREDGVSLQNRLIGFDARYETDDMLRAIRESDVRAFLIPTQGLYFGHKDRPLMELTNSPDREIHYHCYTSPSSDKTISILRMDINHLKTLVHRGFLTTPGDMGSYRLYKPTEYGEHNLLAQHCNAEYPTQHVNIKEERVVLEWEQYRERDNEYFDNLVGATAMLFKLGVSRRKKHEKQTTNIQDYLNEQANY